MVLRSTCLCDGELIGIESIYTVVAGIQINIPEQIIMLREKSRNKELFCPCGCGANLILVAGERNLRKQHFRIGSSEKNRCIYVPEKKVAIEGKIVLKCWLDDKFNSEDIKMRVPVCEVNDTERKFEYSFYLTKNKIALNYIGDRASIYDEKLKVLDGFSEEIKNLYIVDYLSSGCNGNYPERLMKIQNRQGYCLFLQVDGIEYKSAILHVVYYDKDIDDLWQEVEIIKGYLCEFNLDYDGVLSIGDRTLESIKEEAMNSFSKTNEEERKNRCEAKGKQIEEYNKACEDERIKEEKLLRKQEEKEKQLKEQARIREEERKKKEIEFNEILRTDFAGYEKEIFAPDGCKWLQCIFCEKKAPDNDFVDYKHETSVNLGICNDCADNNPLAKEEINRFLMNKRKKRSDNTCPECGGKLVERWGNYGKYWGCKNYPSCKYCEPFKKS